MRRRPMCIIETSPVIETRRLILRAPGANQAKGSRVSELAGSLEKCLKNFERRVLQPDARARLRKLTRSPIEFEDAEPQTCRIRWIVHYVVALRFAACFKFNRRVSSCLWNATWPFS